MAYLILIISSLLSVTVNAENWTLKKQKHGVSVYSQTTESGYNQVKAVTHINAHPLALISLFEDIKSCPIWVYNCISVSVLKDISPSERLVNTFIAAPWPIKDRDMVTYSNTTYVKGTVKITLTDQSAVVPEHPNFVRMLNMNGIWKATPTSQGMTEVSYQGGGEPGGKLPIFIANKELITSFYYTFLNLKKMMPLEKYQPKDTPHSNQ